MINFKLYKLSGLFILGLLLSGCLSQQNIPSVETRSANALKLAKRVGWQPLTIHTPGFSFQSYMPSTIRQGGTLRIYIEGDGFAWRSRETPSDNPTPILPIALQLATKDKDHQRIAYLARACQFISGEEWRSCREDYWTNLRFSPEIIEATNRAVDALKERWGAKKIILIGFSGGGAVAVLVAARRHDVVQLNTVAGILDTKTWAHQKGLRPLRGSLNPADVWEKLVLIPQIHWVGEQDKVVPKEVAQAYTRRFPPDHKPEVCVVPGFDHTCCWSKTWPIPKTI